MRLPHESTEDMMDRLGLVPEDLVEDEITCVNCGSKEIGVSVGLPVFIGFKHGQAIIEVDLVEVADDFVVVCECGDGEVADDDDTLLELLHRVSERADKAPNITLLLA